MRSIRWKLILITFLLVFLPIYFLNHYAIKSFDKFTSKALEEQMISQARMLGEHFKSAMFDEGGELDYDYADEFSKVLRNYSDTIDSRLQILSPQGKVIFDSDPDSLVGSDFSGRPEIANAMKGEYYKAAWHLDEDRKKLYYFVPLAIKHDGKVVAISYVTSHTDQITKAILRMKGDQQAALILALVFAAIVSMIFAYTITFRLRALTKGAKAYARGDKQLEIDVRGRDEVGELAHAVENMAKEIENRNEYNKEFLSTVMHEMKTPVTAIRGAAEVLAEGGCDKPETREKFLSNIIYEANRLNRMVGELSSATKMDVESLRGQKSRMDYRKYVKEALERLMPTFEQDHAGFEAVLNDDVGEVMIVPGRIEQVLSNLLENAFRYTPVDGKVVLSVSRDESGGILTSVSDTGPGIPEASRTRVFERFYTTEQRDVVKDYGSGLGLAVARSIVRNHNGTIWVDESVSDGACICFTLPSL